MASGHPSPTRRPGGRTARNTEAVREATVAVLLDRGVDGFSVAAVAQASGVNQSTIHRRWGSRENLLLDALLHAVDAAVPVPDTGTFPGDARALLDELLAFYGTPLGGAVGALSMGPLGDVTAEKVRQQMWRQRIDDVCPIVSRAIERGELPGTVDPTEVIELLLAPLHLRLLTLGRSPEQCDVEQVVRTLQAGLSG